MPRLRVGQAIWVLIAGGNESNRATSAKGADDLICDAAVAMSLYGEVEVPRLHVRDKGRDRVRIRHALGEPGPSGERDHLVDELGIVLTQLIGPGECDELNPGFWPGGAHRPQRGHGAQQVAELECAKHAYARY